MASILSHIYQEIMNDPANAAMVDKGWLPLYTASEKARIVIIGQAPGRKAQESMTPWDDASGDMLRAWLGVDRHTFYNPDIFALIPMDFFYPGKAAHGDKPPRKDFAPTWHPRLLAAMPNAKLIILIGAYAQAYYLGPTMQKNLTETVRSYKTYLPKFFPLVHPSPLNFRWQAKNLWFQEKVVPALQQQVQALLSQ